MLNSIIIVSALVVLHFIADFILKSDYVARNKSKNNWVLLEHVTIYSLPFIAFISPLYALINAILHLCVDYVTSRLTGKLWASGEVYWFFAVIGLDQLLHILSLIWTYYLLF